MSDTASHLSQHGAAAGSGEVVDVPASGSSPPSGKAPSDADDATMISNRPPLTAPVASDPIFRILTGHVTPGDRLGHFELLEYVGGGGMGRVFRARDTLLGRMVALKVLPPDQASDADALQRFQNEAQSAARLDHDNIVRAFYVGEDRGLNYIAFEFVEGLNVRLLVEQKGPLSLADAVSVTLQVAEALAHAESRDVVHRDIKPSNVLVTPEGRVKLIDMGLARLRQADPAVADLTASGVTLGTFDYISPEQARDPRNADIRSDIYSLGCTVFFMLSGQPPFPQGTVLQKLLQHQGDEPPDIRQFRPELPVELSAILRKMMAKDRARRYAGPAELIADLLLLADQIGLQPVSQTSRVWVVPQDARWSFIQRHVPWIAAVAALVCIVVVLDLTWTSPAPRDERLPTSADVAAVTPQASAAAPIGRLPQSLEKGTSARTADLAKLPVRQGIQSDAPQDAAELPNSRLRNGVAEPTTVTGPAVVSGRGVPELGGISSGATAAGSKLATSPPPGFAANSDPTVQQQSTVLVVTNSPEGDHEFATLAAACAAAHTGDVIELRFNGQRTERPIRIANLNLTIRAAEGYQPILSFRPTDANPIGQPRSMLKLTSGQLTLLDVAMELRIPRDVAADSWSLLETEGGQMVRLERCSLTVYNATDHGSTYHQDVAFIRTLAASNATALIDTARAATPLATVELVDCIARGEADFLQVDQLQPVYLLWDNGLLLTTERLLSTNGSQSSPRPDEMLRIELRHVTAAVRSGLCRMISTPSDPHQLNVQFTSTNSILIAPPSVPLIEQEGASSIEDSRAQFVWNGDRNFYEGVDVFWSISTFDPEVSFDVMNFDAWKTYWGPSRENQPSTERLLWKRAPDANRPLHSQGAGDYTLEDPTFGDASAGAPGCRVDRLPPLPAEPASDLLDWPGLRRTAGAVRGALLP